MSVRNDCRTGQVKAILRVFTMQLWCSPYARVLLTVHPNQILNSLIKDCHARQPFSKGGPSCGSGEDRRACNTEQNTLATVVISISLVKPLSSPSLFEPINREDIPPNF